MKISIGQKIPAFSLQNEDGEIVNSNDLLGSKYLLFFYPKDDSPGCTKAACSVRDNYKSIAKQGYKVFGVSPDKPKKHRKFIDKYEFQFSLLADEEKELINALGLWGPKQFMGREITGVYRRTIFVDEKDVVTDILEKIVTKKHGDQILEKLTVTPQLVG